MTSYFYSESLGKYVALQPLTIGSRTIGAASQAGIDLNWDESGFINNLTFLGARALLKRLGASLLSVDDYVLLLQEVKTTRLDLYPAIASRSYAEWLDTVYHKANNQIRLINHPELERNEVVDQGSSVGRIAAGRPGWFDEQALAATIYPQQLAKNYMDLAGSGTIWKYWSPHRENQWVGGIRGYVISSNTLSLDLDIPLTAHQPALLIREVRDEIEGIDPGPEFAGTHQRLAAAASWLKPAQGQWPEIPGFDGSAIAGLLPDQIDRLSRIHPKEQGHYREFYLDLAGSLAAAGSDLAGLFDTLATKRLPPQRLLTLEGLLAYGRSVADLLNSALDNCQDIVFVIGHEYPDADAVIGTLVEAYRLQFFESRVVLPAVHGRRLPPEIIKLFDVDPSDLFIFTDSPIYQQAVGSGLARWVLVDTHHHPRPKFIDGIVDHHPVPPNYRERQDIYCSSEPAWNSILQIIYKCLGGGLSFDVDLARLLIKATLLEADLLSLLANLNSKDKRLWQQLTQAARIDPGGVRQAYRQLMTEFLSVEAIDSLFWRDYKQDLGNFGMAVVKIKQTSLEQDQDSIQTRLAGLAAEVFAGQNLACVIVSLACYDNKYDFARGSFNVYLGRNRNPEFRREITAYLADYMDRYYRSESGAEIRLTKLGLAYSSVDFQLPRLLVAPGIAEIVTGLDRFFYSPSQKLYVARNLASYKDLSQAGEPQTITGITYGQARELLASTSFRLLSAPEYFGVLADARLINDHVMVRELTSADYTEFLDTVVLDENRLIHHPSPNPDQTPGFTGPIQPHKTPYAHPGLIDLKDIDQQTGLPARVHGPDEYDNKELWRFWAADDYPAVAVRGYIFLLRQPSLDLKIGLRESHDNLGFRLTRREPGKGAQE